MYWWLESSLLFAERGPWCWGWQYLQDKFKLFSKKCFPERRYNLNVIFTGSLVDYLKTTEGSNLPMNTLIDMASQARHLFFYYQYVSALISILHFTRFSFICSFTSCSLSMILIDRKLATVVMRLTLNTNLVITTELGVCAEVHVYCYEHRFWQ